MSLTEESKAPLEENHITPKNSKPSAKTSHSTIERRYRENLNTKITQLDRSLTSTRESISQLSHLDAVDHIPFDAPPPGKTRKADVLNEAIRYVQQTGVESEARLKEIDFLRLRVAALEKLVGCRDCGATNRVSG